MDTDISHETEIKPEVTYLGSLEDFGLGNPDGIPSGLAEASDEERHEYGERAIEAIATVTDTSHFGCIDGRNCIHNHDGSAPQVRRRQVGGTGLVLEVTLNGEAPVTKTLDSEMSINEMVGTLERDYAEKAGVLRSAHTGGCGGVKGAVEDNRSINQNPNIMAATEAIMNTPQVQAQSGVAYDTTLSQRVAEEAGVTAQLLTEKGWNGDAYVQGVAAEEAVGVEDLEIAEGAHHGHKENAIFLVLSADGKQSLSEKRLKELGLGEAFVVNLDASIDMAKDQAGSGGSQKVAQLLIANIAKHVKVSDRLASPNTPLYFMYIPALAE